MHWHLALFVVCCAVFLLCDSARMLPKNLERLTLPELRTLCDERGLDYTGLLKGQVVELLKVHESKIKVLDAVRKSFAEGKSPKATSTPKPKTEGKENDLANGSDKTEEEPVDENPIDGKPVDMKPADELEVRKLEIQLQIERERAQNLQMERERMTFDREQAERDREQHERDRERMAFEREQRERDREIERMKLQNEYDKMKHESERMRHELEMAERQDRTREIERQHELTMKETRLDSSSHGKLGKYGPKTPKFEEGDDIEAYLRTFERLAQANDWPQDTWAPRLAAVLTGKAREAYALMSADDIDSYDKVKLAVLKKYQLGSEAYREKFRSSYKKSDERFQEWGVRVSQYFDRWLEINEIGDFEKLREFVILDQLISMLTPDLQVWIKERKPATIEKMTELAELYVTSRKSGKGGKSKNGKNSDKGGSKEKGSGKKEIVCYNCREIGHISKDCTKRKDGDDAAKAAKGTKKATGTGMLCLSPTRPGYINHKKYIFPGRVNSEHVEMLLDTGCTNTLVRGSLVPKDAYTGSSFQILLANGMTQVVPMADVTLSGTEGTKVCTVGVLESLPVEVLLSEKDFSSIGSLEDKFPGGEIRASPGLVALTRSRKKALVEEEQKVEQLEKLQGVKPISIDETISSVDEIPSSVDSGDIGTTDSLLDEDVEVRTDVNTENTVSVSDQKVDDSVGCKDVADEMNEILSPEYVSDVQLAESEIVSNETQELPHIEMWKLKSKDLALRQKQDKKVKRLFKKVSKSLPKDGIGYFLRNGLLYRRSFVEARQTYLDQLVIPSMYKLELLDLAHNIPLAGHLACSKTRDRLLEHYFWPGLYRDVENYCATCRECQLGARKMASEKAPLISVPVVGIPFHKVATDIVGPVERSARGYKYVLTLVDYATRYPDAIPLKDATAPAVADALVEMFSRYGIPAQMLSDQGSNFMAQLMTELLPRLGIKKLETSCYHPQANGLVERFHSTLKSMLRKFVKEEPKDWDRYLPYMLFAYREVPEASTGFSPFELLYGRAVRGPLAVLKESWTDENPEDTNVVEYVLNARQKLSSMAELVQENLERAQKKQKSYYDQNARGKRYEVGEEVLVMLPCSANKLRSAWQGPFPIVRQVSPVDYEVDTGRHRKRLRIFHVNLLRKWKDRDKVAFYAQAYIFGEEDIDDYLPKRNPTETWEDIHISENLTSNEKKQIRELANKYSSIFSDVPTATNTAVHDVKTGDAKPVRTRPYRLPECQKEPVHQHILELADAKIVEPAPPCAWGSGLVIVPKKDGSIRMCVDFRALNRVTETDSGGNLPRIDELIEKVSRAKYISTLDLCKGYYAIPLSEAAKVASTFVSPFGSYRFRVLPFGMKNAPMTFTRMMNSVLEGTEDFVVVYIDDVAIFSDTFSEHLRHLEEVFKRLQKANLKVKPSKVFLGHASVDYLGHVVGSGRVEPMTAKVEAIALFPRPETKKDVRRFLGLSGYYRRFIPSYSELAASLTDLTKKGKPNRVLWSEDCEKSFQALKKALQEHPVLSPPDYSKPFLLQVDASERGLGAVLAQEDDNGDEHPVVYCSRKLLDREKRLSTIEKECLGIVWSLKLLRPYLLGHEVILETDHNPLVWLNKVKDNNQKLLRWSLAVQEFNLTIRHKKGVDNVGPDCLSRV